MEIMVFSTDRYLAGNYRDLGLSGRLGHGPTKGNRQAPWRARGPPGIFGFGQNPCKTLPWEGLGGNWYTQKVPGYHGNHSPLEKSCQTSWGTTPSTKTCFSGPHFGPPKGARAFGDPDLDLGLQKWGPGLKISKLRVEKPCRTHWSIFQTEPYVASYGPKPFWDISTQIWAEFKSTRGMCRQGGTSAIFGKCFFSQTPAVTDHGHPRVRVTDGLSDRGVHKVGH